MEIFLAAMHGVNLWWDMQFTLELLAEMAVMADYYDVRKAMSLLSNIQNIDLHVENVNPLEANKDVLHPPRNCLVDLRRLGLCRRGHVCPHGPARPDGRRGQVLRRGAAGPWRRHR